MSAMAPASSTPVGPPPTITKVRWGRCARDALRSLPTRRQGGCGGRISVACSSVFSPGANSSHSDARSSCAWPRKARMRKSQAKPMPSASVARFAARSTFSNPPEMDVDVARPGKLRPHR